MSSTLYQIYQGKVFRLAATTIVKHGEVAVQMNQFIAARGYVVDIDRPASWKYYLNLAGFYHESDFDDIAAINGVTAKYRGIYPRLAELTTAYQNKGKLIGDFAIVAGSMLGTSWVVNTRLPLQHYVWDGAAWVLSTAAIPVTMTIKVASSTGPIDTGFTRHLVDPSSPYFGDVAIANEYRYGGTYYQQLIARYSAQEALIIGILNPVETTIALACEDGDVLVAGGYFRRHVSDALGERTIFTLRSDDNREDDVLIEPNEDNLIPGIQDWIKGFLARWHNRNYALTDDLYLTSVLGVLYSVLPKLIMNLRLANCHTPQVHSYHVAEYLDSHGRLGRYTSALSLKQTLWLYRNVRYLEANAGKQEVFQSLLDNLATPSKIPLAGYSLRHNLSLLPKDLLTYTLPQLPEPQARREVLNFYANGGGPATIPIRELLEKEAPLATGNAVDVELVLPVMEDAIINAPGNEFETKLIESRMLDLTDRLPYPFADVLMNYWLFCASRGTYTGTVYVTHPVSGDRLSLTPLNAFVLALYCYNRAYTNTTLTTIPVVNARIIPRSPTFTPHASLAVKPSIAQIQNVVDPIYRTTTPARTITYWVDAITEETVVYPAKPDTVTRLYNIPYDPAPASYALDTDYTHNTADGFYKGAVLVHQQLMKRYYEVVKEEYADARGQMEFAMSLLYWSDVPCVLSAQTTYAGWFAETGISVATLETVDYQTLYLGLATQLVKQATGNRTNKSERLLALHKAVVGIMQQFSSYAIQYTRHLNESPALNVDMKTLRIRRENFVVTDHIRAPINTFGVRRIDGQATGDSYTIPTGLSPAITPPP